MVVTKANSVIHNTKHARHKNSHAKTSNVSDPNIDAMAKTIAVIILMKWAVRRRRTAHVQQDNSHAPMDNVSKRKRDG